MWVIATLLLGLSLSILGSLAQRSQQEAQDRARMDRFAQRVLMVFEAQRTSYEDILYSAQGLFASSNAVDAQAWKTFVEALDLPGRHPDLKLLTVIRRIPRNRLAAFLQEPGPRQWPAGLHPIDHFSPEDTPLADPEGDLFPIIYAEPAQNRSRALGLDVATSAIQREAALRAMDTGKPSATGCLMFFPKKVPTRGLGFFIPIYTRGPAPSTLAERRQRLWGWVSAGFYLDPLLEGIRVNANDTIALEARDETQLPGQVLYTSPGWNPPEAGTLVRRQEVEMGGRHWILTYRALPTFYRTPGRSSGLSILLGGTLLTLSLAATFWTLASTRNRSVALARSLTKSMHTALQRFECLVENTPLGVIEWDTDLVIRAWNPAAERIFGYRAQEVLGRRGDGFLLPNEGRSLHQSLSGADLAPGDRHHTGRFLRKDHQAIECEWSNTPIRDTAGQVTGITSLVLDVTEKRRTEEARQSRKRFESLGALAGGIAHDFNNMLAAITGSAELAQKALSEASPAFEHLQRIEATAHRAATLARQMLAYAGKAPVLVTPLDLNGLVATLVELLRDSIPGNVAVRLDLDPTAPHVIADEAQIQQVVLNLLTNASEAIGELQGRIQVRTLALVADEGLLARLIPGSTLKPGPCVVLEVGDTGCGMDAATQQRIFDPFFTTKFAGRGLGLSSMLGILKGHGAGISVESRRGEGSIFRLYFPASDERSEAQSPESEAPAKPARPCQGRVLLVDDEPMLRLNSAAALEAAGFEVLVAQDGVEALERFQAQAHRGRIDAVVMDMTMPRMDGMEAFRRLRKLDATVPVILSSGFTEDHVPEAPGTDGPEGFLHKPYRLKELVECVRSLLESRKRGN